MTISLTTMMKKKRIEEIKAFALALQTPDFYEVACSKDGIFDVLELAQEYGFEPSRLVDEIGIAHSTVSRWINGKAEIGRAVYRREIVRVILSDLTAKAKSMEAALGLSGGNTNKSDNKRTVENVVTLETKALENSNGN